VLADELLCVAGWLDREAARIRVLHSDGPLLLGRPALPTYLPRRVPAAGGRR